MDFPIVQIAGSTVFTALLTRFIRQADSTAGLRQNLGEKSAFLGKLLGCPHCLCFWLALFPAALFSNTLLQFCLILLFVWRASYYLNKLLDFRRSTGGNRAEAPQHCRQCRRLLDARPLERQNHSFCSQDCWFDYLKAERQARNQPSSTAAALTPQEIYPMSYDEISPDQAKALLDGDEGYVYIDVRSVPEFENGHPAGSHNIPIFHRTPMGMTPNPEFLAIVQAHFDPSDKILVGCQMGGRSARAAQALVASGFTSVSNVAGGFGGARNEAGEVVAQGWVDLGLPVENGAPEGRSYTALGGKV